MYSKLLSLSLKTILARKLKEERISFLILEHCSCIGILFQKALGLVISPGSRYGFSAVVWALTKSM